MWFCTSSVSVIYRDVVGYSRKKLLFAIVLRAQKSSGQLTSESLVRVKVRPPCSDHPASGAIRASKRCHRDPTVRNMK